MNLDAFLELEALLQEKSTEELEAIKEGLEKSIKEKLPSPYVTSKRALPLDVLVCASTILKSRKHEK